MSNELVKKPTLSIAELEERQKRRELRSQKRQTLITEHLASIQFDSIHDVNLRKHAGKTDADLDVEIMAGRMSVEDAWKVKEWRKPKRIVAYAIEAAQQHVTSVLKRDDNKPSVKINVENATIQLPEKRDETVPPVYIDVIASEK